MRLQTIAIGLAAVLGLVSAEALACSCGFPGEDRAAAQAAFDEADVVFRGTVTHVSRFTEGHSDYRRITYEVAQAWKGLARTRIEIATAYDGATCGIYAEVGYEYLIFANAPGEGEVSSVPYLAQLCNGSIDFTNVRPEWRAFLDEQPELTLSPHSGCSSAGLGLSVWPLIVVGGWLRRRRAQG